MKKKKTPPKADPPWAEKMKTKIELSLRAKSPIKTKILICALLFLFLPFAQVKAANLTIIPEITDQVFQHYIYRPIVDLAKFTGENLSRTYQSFPPFVIATNSYFKGVAYFGQAVQKSLGQLFFTTGNLLAKTTSYLPNFSQVSQKTADFYVAGIMVFKDYGKIFKISGEYLAVIPNNLPNIQEVTTDLSKVLLVIGNKSSQSINGTSAFFKESFNNLTKQPEWQDYPYTQRVLSRTKEIIENNFNKIIVGLPVASAQYNY